MPNKLTNRIKYDEDWKDEALTKFPRIEMDIKTLSKSHVNIQNSLLNDIRRKENAEFNKRIAAIDRQINMKYLMNTNYKYLSLVRSRKPVSTFFEKSMISKIMNNVKKIRKIKDYDFTTGNIYLIEFIFHRILEN